MSNRYSDAYDPQITMEDLGQPTRAEAEADARMTMTDVPERAIPLYNWRDRYTAEELAQIDNERPF